MAAGYTSRNHKHASSGPPWTEEDEEALLKLKWRDPRITNRRIAAILKRTTSAIACRCNLLGIRRNKRH